MGKKMKLKINLNADVAEGYGRWTMGNDKDIISEINSANIACGYHAGDEPTMRETVEISKRNRVSIGAHPSFNDPENFGRKRLNLSPKEINKLIIDQINILSEIAEKKSMKVTHVKPHGALNNMACEDFELASVISKSIINANKDLIFLVPTGSQMEKAGKKLNMKVAAEIFADRNYEDDGNLVSRSKKNALITDPVIAKKHVVKMVQNQALNCFSGKQIPCEIDSVCVHGDGKNAVKNAQEIKDGLINSNVSLKPLDLLNKFR